MYYVYVIQNSEGKIYIGQTDNIEKRLRQHNDKNFDKRSFTKLNGTEWALVYKEESSTRKIAIKREKQLKSYRGREFIKTITGR